MKKLLAFMTCAAMLLCSVPLAASAEDADEIQIYEDITPRTPEEKISQDLRDEMSVQTDAIPVAIWRRSFTDAYMDQKTNAHLPENYDEITDEMERVNALQHARTEALKELFIPTGEALLDALGVTGDDRGWISMFTPLITCKLTPAQIVQASGMDEVAELYLNGTPSYTTAETVFVVTEKDTDSMHLLEIAQERPAAGFLYAVLSDETTGDDFYSKNCKDFAKGDLLLYTGGFWYTQESEAPPYPINRIKGSFEKIGTLSEQPQIRDAVEQSDTGYTLHDEDGSVQAYAKLLAAKYKAPFGDVNYDGSINASDAAVILIDAAMRGATEIYYSTDPERDINADGSVNATDAALLLQYAADTGAGATNLRLPAYLLERDHTVMRVAVEGDFQREVVPEPIEILDSVELLTAYFTEKTEPREIKLHARFNWLSYHRDADIVRGEISAVYDAAFFAEHHLAAIRVTEGDLQSLPEVRCVETAKDGTVTISLYHVHSSYESSPLEGQFVVLAAVGKDVTDASQITLNQSSILIDENGRVLYF